MLNAVQTGDIEVVDRSPNAIQTQQVVEGVREVLLIELACLRRLSLVAAVRAKVGARPVGPRSVEAAIGQLRVVRTKVGAERQPVGDLQLRVR